MHCWADCRSPDKHTHTQMCCIVGQVSAPGVSGQRRRVQLLLGLLHPSKAPPWSHRFGDISKGACPFVAPV